MTILRNFLLLLILALQLSPAFGKEFAEVVECSSIWPQSCVFRIYSNHLELNQQHRDQGFTLYHEGLVAFSGNIIGVTEHKAGQPQTVTIKGSWWVHRSRIESFTKKGIPLSLTQNAPIGPQRQQVPSDPSHDDPLEALSLSNEWGEPILSVFGRMGTPTSPTSRAGVTFELSPKRHYPSQVGFGTYESPSNAILNEPKKQIQNISMGQTVLLGKVGSQLALGLTAVHTKARISTQADTINNQVKSSRIKEFLGVIPHLGLRFTSDNYYVLTIDFGKYQGIGGNLDSFIGDTPVGSTVLDGTKVMTYIGLGVGI